MKGNVCRIPARIAGVLCASLFTLLPLRAQVLTIDLPELTLQQNTATSFDLLVQNTSGSVFPVTGVRLDLSTGLHGGPEAGLGDTISAPHITQVDVVTDTVFSINNQGNLGKGAIVPQVFERSTLTTNLSDSPTILNIPAGSSTLAHVVLDTTGIAPGTYLFTADTGAELQGASVFHTTSGDYQPVLISGSLTVVPEPSQYALIFAVATGAFGFLRKRFKRA